MSSESVSGGPQPQVVAYSGPVADPRSLAVTAQALIAVESVVQVAGDLSGGPGSKLITQVQPIILLATVVVFLCWFRRCRLNAEVFAPGTHTYTPGFAVGGWFIPVAGLWMPRRTALDIHRASGAPGGERLINAWWVAWVAKVFGGVIAVRFVSFAAPYDLVASVAAGVLAVLVIRRITAGQDEKIRAEAGASPFARDSAA